MLHLAENNHCFCNIKTVEWDIKVLLLEYCNDLVLRTVEIPFLEVGAYVSPKQATTAV